jgi:predicted RNase H-like HicB family nuclease
MNRYHINVFWSDEDACWVADVPDLRTCSAFGETPQEALAQVQIAMEAWLATARENGMAIPEPRYRPAIYAA